MKKGNIVLVKAQVVTSYKPRPELQLLHKPTWGNWKKKLYRLEYTWPRIGMVVGKSYRATGSRSNDMDDIQYLSEDKRHPVVMVISIKDDRWIKPIPCLEEDLELYNEKGT